MDIVEEEGVAVYDDLEPVDVPKEDVPKEPVEEETPQEDQETEQVDETPAEEEQVNDPAPEGDPIQSEARAQGWVPLDEWKGDPKDWRDADIFLERGEYFRKIKALNDKSKELEQQLDVMASYQKEAIEKTRQETIKELTAKKVQALENQEFEKYVELDNDLRKAEQESVEDRMGGPKYEYEPKEPSLSDQQAWVDFEQDNTWYTQDQEMTEYADTVGIGYKNRNPDADAKSVLEYVEKEVKARYPRKFGANKNEPSPVASNANRGTRPPRS